MKPRTSLLFCAVALMGVALAFAAASTVRAGASARRPKPARWVGPDLMIQDDDADVGAEPYPSSTPWLSPSIWVTPDPLPGYLAVPFPAGSPPFALPPGGGGSAEYRSPLYGKPNYIYVRVKNVGTSVSSGNERLKVYWSSASTGLSWPMSWRDNVQTVGGHPVLFGQEATKPRMNAMSAGVTAADRDEFRDALLDTARSTSVHPLAPGTETFWRLQQTAHASTNFPTASFSSYAHHFPAFLPWHREMINRFEAMMQEAHPKVKLMYWDWSAAGQAAAIFAQPNFVGSGTGPAGAPLYPAMAPASGSTVSRNNSGATGTADASLFLPAAALYPAFRSQSETGQRHDGMHSAIGGTMSNPLISATDPFFFFLHSNADRLWAKWQRGNLAVRTDPGNAYGTDASNYHLSNDMGPWAFPWSLGPSFPSAAAVGPWTTAGYAVGKQATDDSVLSPPIYDDTPLTIPPLGPGQEIVLEVPWYPPNPASFGAVVDPQHVCLLARIETADTSPFGMTTLETSDVGVNTVNNNNVAWRNIAVVDDFVGALKAENVMFRNPFRGTMVAGLSLQAAAFAEQGTIRIDLGRELFARWQQGGAQGDNVEAVPGTTSVRALGPSARIRNLPLRSAETFAVPIVFELNRRYAPTAKRLVVDLRQFATEDGKDKVVGGQRFELDVQKLRPVPRGGEWRFADGARIDGLGWTLADFSDGKWAMRRTELGFGERARPGQSPNLRGDEAKRATRTLFRRAFDVDDPGFFQALTLQLKYADGAAAYLNGKEVFRDNLGPNGAIRARKGLEGDVFNLVKLDPGLLTKGANVLAVEVQRVAGSEGMSFDAELSGNWTESAVGPAVRFSTMWNGRQVAVRKGATVEAQALPGSRPLASVAFYVDGKLLKTITKAPFAFAWKPAAGARRLRVVARGADGREAVDYASVQALANVPPTVDLRRPLPQTKYALSDAIEASASAADVDGKIKEIRFFAREHTSFAAPDLMVGVATKAPYTVKLSGLKTGMYMVWAVATDDQKATGISNPTMIVVGQPGRH